MMDDKASRDIATRIAFRAGRLAVAKVGAPGYLSWRGRRDVIVGAAVEIQELIESILREECPGDAILSEEGPEDEPVAIDSERLWIVDPICGSLNFVMGIPFFAISLALRVNGNLRVGVVYDPMRDEMFSAQVGQPATLNNQDINVRAVSLGPEFWEQAWVAADLPHDGPVLDEALRIYTITSRDVQHHLVLGSPALAICYVACGRLHAYWNIDARPWDVAAAGVVLGQAGGHMTDADGGSWLHSTGTYVAAEAVSHNWALKTIKMVREQTKNRANKAEGILG
jgi:myo-inositol-1(or 4)-monophosphatase